MTAQIEFTIPGKPVGKGRPRARIMTANGKQFVHLYTDKETVDTEKVVAQLARLVMGPRNPFSGPLVMELLVHHPIPASWSKKDRQAALDGETACMAKPDLDNVVKLVLDALNKIVYTDDKQVVGILARKQYGMDPRVEVKIKPQ